MVSRCSESSDQESIQISDKSFYFYSSFIEFYISSQNCDLYLCSSKLWIEGKLILLFLRRLDMILNFVYDWIVYFPISRHRTRNYAVAWSSKMNYRQHNYANRSANELIKGVCKYLSHSYRRKSMNTWRLGSISHISFMIKFFRI